MKKVFGLDIGTRSIVGTVGYRENRNFYVLAQRVLEHETRSMLEGQIHDIEKVARSIARVKAMLEEDLGEKLTDVCIAAAGRVLRTVTTNVEIGFDGEKDITHEDTYELSMLGVQKAYEEFYTGGQNDMRFYCVGYTVMRYYVNGYQMGNPENHKARTLGADLIATFLPDDVVDGLYKAVELAGLKVANLTLEPIAAIQVAIPEKFRQLNLALVDVGAGTSDICITKEGTITAYGMIPVAGDNLTDCIAQNCLVDFDTAEQIKRAIGEKPEITYEDILGVPYTKTVQELSELVRPVVEEMTKLAADAILELNGDKPVGAVFVVGGGGIIPGYTENLAAHLGIPKERVAIRGKEVMQNIVFEIKDARQDSMMVTPIGICYSYYEQTNNFIFVEFNGIRTKLYDNGKLTVGDAAIQSQFPNENLFPKRGDALTYTVNERSAMTRGGLGEPSVLTVNGEHADLNTQIKNGDRVDVISSTKGEEAVQELGKLPEMRGSLTVRVNGQEISLPKMAEVNGSMQSIYYRVSNGDEITVRDWYTVQDIASYMGLTLGGSIFVNDTPAKPDTRVYDSFSVSWTEDGSGAYDDQNTEWSKEETARRDRSIASVSTDEPETLEVADAEEAEWIAEEAAPDAPAEAAQPAGRTYTAPVGIAYTVPAEAEPSSPAHTAPSSTTYTAPTNTAPSSATYTAPTSKTPASSTHTATTGAVPAGSTYAAPTNTAPSSPTYTALAGSAPLSHANTAFAGSEPASAAYTAPTEAAQASTAFASPIETTQTTPSAAVAQDPPKPADVTSASSVVTVVANGRPVAMQGKRSYVYVDIFDYINFDLTRPMGKAIVTKLNGRTAEYLEEIHNGDNIEIYWE